MWTVLFVFLLSKLKTKMFIFGILNCFILVKHVYWPSEKWVFNDKSSTNSKAQHNFSQKKHSDPPVSLHGQLLWREFFYTASVGIPNFNKMTGNPACTQVDWDENQEYLAAWREVLAVLRVSPLFIAVSKSVTSCSPNLFRLGPASPSSMPSWLSWDKKDGFTTWPDTPLPVSSPEETCGSAGRKDRRCIDVC